MLDNLKTATKKVRKVLARYAYIGEEVVTIIDGKEETRNVAKYGDYVITGSKGEEYIISSEKRHKLYETEIENIPYKDDIFILKTLPVTVSVKEYKGESFSFIASWGENMICNDGDFLVMENDGVSFYRIEREAFFNTYDLED